MVNSLQNALLSAETNKNAYQQSKTVGNTFSTYLDNPGRDAHARLCLAANWWTVLSFMHLLGELQDKVKQNYQNMDIFIVLHHYFRVHQEFDDSKCLACNGTFYAVPRGSGMRICHRFVYLFDETRFQYN